jgi:hypothetical protein
VTNYPSRCATDDDAPPRLTLRVPAGNEWWRAFLFRQDDGAGNRVPIPMEGYAFRAYVSVRYDSEPLLEIAIDDGRAAQGVVFLSLTEAQTLSVTPGTYFWRLRTTAPGDVERTRVDGPMEISRR